MSSFGMVCDQCTAPFFSSFWRPPFLCLSCRRRTWIGNYILSGEFPTDTVLAEQLQEVS